MSEPRTVARGLWALLCTTTALIGWRAASGDTAVAHNPGDTSWVELVLPLVFFAVQPIWMRGHPFDFGPLRKSVDANHGTGTYDTWIKAIRPVLLMGAAALAAAAACALNGWRIDAPAGAFVIAGSFLSAALGLGLCWLTLRLMRKSLE
jgi:hypothetical protein